MSVKATSGAIDLVADIGGTNARFALVDERMQPFSEATLRCADYPTLTDAVHAYLASIGAWRPHAAAFAVATAVTGDSVRLTNSDWAFSTEQVRRQAGLDRLLVLNDFTALAYALPFIAATELRQVGGGTAVPNSTMGVIGPGTGLGVSGLIPSGNHWIPLQGEGGHSSFSPADARETEILNILWREHPHVSVERLVSGMGMPYLHQAIAQLEGHAYCPLTPAELTTGALQQRDPLCIAVLEAFCAMLGSAAGNLALTLGARGGVYIGGGIVQKLGDFFDRSAFRQRFEAKGRFSAYLSAIPTFVILADNPALTGAAWALRQG